MRNQFDATDLDLSFNTYRSVEKIHQKEALEDLVGKKSVEKKTFLNKKQDKKICEKQVKTYKDQNKSK